MKGLRPNQMVGWSYIFNCKGELRFSYLGIVSLSVTLKFSFELRTAGSQNFIMCRLSLLRRIKIQVIGELWRIQSK